MHGVSEVGAFACGVLGGVLPEFLAIYRQREAPQKSEKFRRWSWRLPTIGMILLGGGLAFLYVDSGNTLTPLLAVNVGASAPLILGSLVAAAPTIPPGKVG